MSTLLRLLFFALRQRSKATAVRDVKRRALLVYLRALQGLRLTVTGFLVTVFLFQILAFSFVGAVVTGAALLESDPERRLQILFAVFTCVSLVPFVALAVLLSGRLWYRASGAAKWVDELRKS